MSTAPIGRNRDFILLQSGQLLSKAGSGMSAIAYPLLVLGITHSPAQAGIVQAARLAPFLLFSTLAGVLADRTNRRRLMILSDLVSATALATIVLAIVIGEPTFWQMLAVGFIDGAASVVFGAAYSGAFRAVVPRQQLPAAASIEQTRASAVRLAAPPIGGALYAVARILPFLGDVITYGFSMLSISLMRTPFQEERPPEQASVKKDLVEGLRFLWNVPFLRMSALMTAASNFTFSGGQFAVIVLARREGYSSGAIGLLVALVGATTLAGSLASPLIRRVLSLRAILLSEFWAAFGLITFLIWPNAVVLGAALACQAFCFPNTDAALASYRYAITPDRLTSRVTTAASNIAVVAMPLGPLVAGLLLDSVSVKTAVLVVASASMVAAVVGTISRGIRDLPPLAEVVSAQPAEAG
ncbi:MAG: MFS transporter [Dehalococcoidia bacterium]